VDAGRNVLAFCCNRCLPCFFALPSPWLAADASLPPSTSEPAYVGGRGQEHIGLFRRFLLGAMNEYGRD